MSINDPAAFLEQLASEVADLRDRVDAMGAASLEALLTPQSIVPRQGDASTPSATSGTGDIAPASMVARGAITADSIAAGAIVVGKLGDTPTQLVPNGGFEDLNGAAADTLGVLVRGWDWPTQPSYCAYSTDEASGTYALVSRHLGDTTQKDVRSRPVPVLPSRRICLRYKYKASAGNNAANAATIGVEYYTDLSCTTWITTAPVEVVTLAANTSWTQRTLYATTPSNAAAMQVLLRHNSGGAVNDDLRVDDVELFYLDDSSPGRNLLRNSGFRGLPAYPTNWGTNEDGWQFQQNGDSTAICRLYQETSTEWVLRDGDVDNWSAGGPYGTTAYIYSTAAGTTQPYLVSQPVRVEGGREYSLGVLIGNHRCTSIEVGVWWYDGSDTYITVSQTSYTGTKLGGPKPSDFERVTVEAMAAPTNAEYAKVFIIATGPITSSTDRYCFIDQVWFGTGRYAPEWQPNEAMNARNPDGNVVIDSTGITISNGKLTLRDEWDSTVATASGFSGGWMDFIGNGLYNPYFAGGGAEDPLTVGRTGVLPYWTTAKVSTPAVAVATGTSWPGGRYLKAVISNIAQSVTATSDIVPIVPAQYYNAEAWVAFQTVDAGVTAAVRMKVTFYKADGVTTTGTTDQTVGSYPTGSAVTTPFRLVSGPSVLSPNDARFAKLKLELICAAGSPTTTDIRVGGGRLLRVMGTTELDPAVNYEVGKLRASDMVIAVGGMRTLYKAGAIGDSDFSEDADGNFGIDGTNHRLYMREAGGWHYINRTAGFQIPVDVDGVDERVCPVCDVRMEVGEPVAGLLDDTMSDGALHGRWAHLRCLRP
jgi:hypothetical protein